MKKGTSQKKERDSAQTRLKAEFFAAHKKGIRSLRSHDFKGLSHAIARERAIIQKERDLIEKARKRTLK